jgi:uncharacterized protein YjdB
MPPVARSIVWLAALSFVATTALTACGGQGVSCQDVCPPDTTVHSVLVSPAFDTVTIGGKLTLVDTVKGDGGVTFYHETVTWSSSATSVATVDSTGVVTGVAVGTVIISAVSNSNRQARGSAAVTVVATP